MIYLRLDISMYNYFKLSGGWSQIKTRRNDSEWCIKPSNISVLSIRIVGSKNFAGLMLWAEQVWMLSTCCSKRRNTSCLKKNIPWFCSVWHCAIHGQWKTRASMNFLAPKGWFTRYPQNFDGFRSPEIRPQDGAHLKAGFKTKRVWYHHHKPLY